MRVLIVGDLHLRAKKLKDVSNAWSSAINWAHANGVDLVVQAGDVFDHSNVYGREASTGTIYSSFLSPFSSQDKPIPLFVIPGNHDIGAPRDKDALCPIDGYPWIRVIRKPMVCGISKNFSICAIPWVNRVHLISRLLSRGMRLDEATRHVSDLIASLTVPLAEETRKHQNEGRFVLMVGHLEITGARLAAHAQHGGSFEFSPASLQAIGADAYALAHIHIRQAIAGLPNENDGYLGCLCQLNFGEEGNSVGCRLLETDGRKIVSDKWLDNRSSPRYFTADYVEGLNFRPGVDYVKIRGFQRPDALPEGVIFERLPEQAQARLRTDDKLDCDMSLRQLLSAWCEVSNCHVDLDALVSEAEKLSSVCQIQAEAIGSIERISRIRLNNLTCHAHSDIDTRFTGICGIAGPNGSGKTTAIEAIMLALYGVSPSRPAIGSMIPKGDSVESSVELEFVSAGRKYKAVRKFSKGRKTTTQTAYIFDLDKQEDDKPVASGAEGVFAYSSQLVGDCDLVLAGIFSSQGDSGNLVKLKPAPRKDLFAKLLGTEKFIVISEAAKKIAQADAALIAAQKLRQTALNVELSSEDDDRHQVDLLASSVAGGKEIIEASKEEIERYKAKLISYKHQKNEIERIAAEISELEKKRANVVKDGKSAKDQKKEFESLGVESLEKELAEAKKAREELDALNQQLDEASRKSGVLARSAIEHVSEAKEKLNQRAIAYSQFKLQYEHDLNALRQERQDGEKEIADKIGVLRGSRDSIQDKIIEANRRTALLKGFPDLPECQTCPLAKDSILSRSSVAGLEAEFEKFSERIRKGEEVLKEYRAASGDAIGDLRVTMVAEEDWQPDAIKEAADLELIAKTFEAQSKSCISVEMIHKRGGLMTKSTLIKPLEEQIAKASSAKTEIAKFDATLEVLRKNVKEIDEEIGRANERMTSAKFDFDEAAYKSLESTTANLQSNLDESVKDLSAMTVDFGKSEARMEQHEARRKELGSLDVDIKQKEDKAAIYEALTRACGRDGIPQLIVDSAIPHLQDIMFDMMSEIDGKWTIRIATQRETGKGTIQERIEILVDDGDDERDISTYSGGEMNLLSTIIRIAFSILQAERSGKGLKVLVLDEAMYFADNEYSDAFMRMLRKLPKYFNQIFVISHSEYVLSSIQDKMFFSRSSSGKSVVQVDFPTNDT